MRMATIASGSSGNCTYIGSDDTHILIDAGVSAKRITEGLNRLGLSASDLDAVFVTHEHSDHICGLPVIEKKYGLPVFCSGGTAKGIFKADTSRYIDRSLVNTFCSGDVVECGDLEIMPVDISHDALEPTAFRITCGTKSAAVATDMGVWDEELAYAFKDLDAILIESNHDIRMLQAGPYPYHLKQRILSEMGHLSNEACSEFLCTLLHDKLKGVLLGHLSATNNYPELAYETVRTGIELGDVPYHGDDFLIEVAPRSVLSRVLEF